MKTKFNTLISNFNNWCNKSFDTFNTWFRKHLLLIVFLFVTIVALIARTAFINYTSGDMACPLIPWFNYLRENGNFKALGNYPNWEIYLSNGIKVPCDYPVSYINILAFLSLFSSNAIATIKWSTFIADILLALGVLFIVHYFTKNKFISLISYICVLFAPSVFANSALWGQCDQTYVAIIVWAFYLLLKEKNCLASILIGLAISLKLQSVFFLPFLVFLWLNKKYRMGNLLIIFVTIFITFIPSYIAGAPFVMPFNAYINQMGLYPNVNYGSASMYAFLEMTKNNEVFSLSFALIIILLVLFVFYYKKVTCTKKNMVYVAAFFALICPFVLPHMHERYFFMADIFILIYVFVFKKQYYLAALMIFSSVNNYTHFLTGAYIFKFLDQDCVRLSALINLFIIIKLIRNFKDLEREQNVELLS